VKEKKSKKKRRKRKGGERKKERGVRPDQKGRGQGRRLERLRETKSEKD
jgi:hypothetical protein